MNALESECVCLERFALQQPIFKVKLELSILMTEPHKYLQGFDLSKLPVEAGPVLIALGQFQSGEVINQLCPHCRELITVSGKAVGTPTPCVWFISCPCGKCNNTMRGL